MTVAALATAAAAAVTTGDQPAAPDQAATPEQPTTLDQEAGMVAGVPFADPPDVAVASGKGRLSIVLEATEAHLDVAGRKIWGKAYNGSFVGPTLHLTPGQPAEVRLVNHLTVATNIHFHGLHVTPAKDGDNPNVCVPPGQTHLYRLPIPADHPQGSFWYHSHAMAASCSPPEAEHEHADPGRGRGDTENQISSGLSGAIVVGDVRRALPAAYHDLAARTFVLKDVQLDGDGRIRQNTETAKIDSKAPAVRLVNGLLRPVVDLRPGETQLWRLVNAGANIAYQLALDGFRFAVVGEDGRPVAAVTTPTSLPLPPGKRFDVLVTAPDSAGAAQLRTTAFNTGPTGDTYPDAVLAKVAVAGPAVTPPLPVPSAVVSAARRDLASATVAQRRTLTLSQDRETGLFTINGKSFSTGGSVFDAPAVLGTVEEWTILNASGVDHPFHLHTNGFQVMSVDGRAKDFTGWQDVVQVVHPPSFDAQPGQVVVRIEFADFVGRWMFHCHVASHEDNGMMSFVDVVPGALPFTG